jgi:uncharacterized membrane protein SirB2
MRILKLGAVGAIVVVVLIAALRIADVITAAQAPWLARRALAAIALLVVAGIALGAVTGRSPSAGPADRPIP